MGDIVSSFDRELGFLLAASSGRRLRDGQVFEVIKKGTWCRVFRFLSLGRQTTCWIFPPYHQTKSRDV